MANTSKMIYGTIRWFTTWSRSNSSFPHVGGAVRAIAGRVAQPGALHHGRCQLLLHRQTHRPLHARQSLNMELPRHWPPPSAAMAGWLSASSCTSSSTLSPSASSFSRATTWQASPQHGGGDSMVQLHGKQLFVLTVAIVILSTTWLKNLAGLGRRGRQVLPHGGKQPLESAQVAHHLPTTLSLYFFIYFIGHGVFPTVHSLMKSKKDFPKVHFLKCIYMFYLIVSLLNFVITINNVNLELWLMKIEKSMVELN